MSGRLPSRSFLIPPPLLFVTNTHTCAQVRVLEDLIIECLYANIFAGKLDQKREQLEISTTMGRDVRPDDIGDLIAKIEV